MRFRALRTKGNGNKQNLTVVGLVLLLQSQPSSVEFMHSLDRSPISTLSIIPKVVVLLAYTDSRAQTVLQSRCRGLYNGE